MKNAKLIFKSGVIFGIVEFFAGMIFYVMDAAAERTTKKFQSDVLEGLYLSLSVSIFLRLFSSIFLSFNINCVGEQPIDIKAVRHFPAIFWLITLCASAYYAVVFPFESTAEYVHLMVIYYN